MMAWQLRCFFFVAFLLTVRRSDSAKLCGKDIKGEEVRFCEKQKSGNGIDGHQVTEKSASVGGVHREVAEFVMDYTPAVANPEHSRPSPPPGLPSSPPPHTPSTPLPPQPPPPTDG